MWSDNKSLVLSRACVVAFMLLLIACVVIVPLFFGSILLDIAPTGSSGSLEYTDTATDPNAERQVWFFRATVYTGAVPAGVVLVLMFNLLSRIGKGEIFIKKNVNCLRYISWCCFIGAVISIISMYYWVPWSAVAIAAAFMGLIVRVVKNCFAKAVSLQDDADLTV